MNTQKKTFEKRPIFAIHCGLLSLGFLLWPQSAMTEIPFNLFAATLQLLLYGVTMSMFFNCAAQMSKSQQLKFRALQLLGLLITVHGCIHLQQDISRWLLFSSGLLGMITTLFLHELHAQNIRRPGFV